MKGPGKKVYVLIKEAVLSISLLLDTFAKPSEGSPGPEKAI